ncbi:hypothetical protein GT037_003925 [Alternaria burnsii]|uniref:Uncharacterized protein n=1 Tax=Alternaria burnsii TaxID=1187904 RepID=A0A8H7B6S6_9PLEO|nr:uncharacterized protein GT037_003925 [Alternaria burnsii]KAF7678544.1 hypothetical protein GT037_003925 [Alternaria burnsii]
MEEIDRQSSLGFNTAVELHKQHEFDDCIKALRNLLADDAIPRYHRIKCLALLACLLDDWNEGYSCYIKAETIWRIAKQWHHDETNPVIIKYALYILKKGTKLHTLRQILFEDDERPEDAPDPEADVLHAIAVYTGVGGDREIAEVKEETWSEEMSDEDVGDEDMGDEDMSDEEEVGDKEPMFEVEQKVGGKEESEAQNVDAKETVVER